MDADRFDTFTRSLGASTSRRAALGATLAGGPLGALGLARSVPEASAAQGGICTLAFSSNVRLGPGLNQPLSAENQPGALRGNLSFGLDRGGRLTGELQVSSGERFPVVGQATGNSLQARIELAPRVALVVVGVGEQEVATCRGAIDGIMSGPQVGDLGDWHATAAGASGGGSNSGGRGSNSGGRGSNSGGGSSSGGTGGTPGGSGRGSTAGSSSSSNAPSCPAGETYCAYVEECRDLRTSPVDCGACATRCPSLVCQEGRCLSEEEADSRGSTGLACDPGETICDGRCVSLRTDPGNCGSCGNACDFNVASCQDGTCVFRADETCPTGQIPCGANCCDACPSGTVNCGSDPPLCVDPLTDPTHCGLCGTVCATGETCQGGACVASGGGGCRDGSLTYCSGVCVDLMTDPDNCGACGTRCPVVPETYNCEGGVCVPPSCAPLTNCGGLCDDLLTSSLNCGACGIVCPEGTTCQFGTCTTTTTEAPPPLTCGDQGLIECFGACVDLQTDPNNCGYCGEVCPSGLCDTGICVEVVGPAPVSCDGGTVCGGVCVDLINDPNNCAACGFVCPDGPEGRSCIGGVCVQLGSSV